MLAILVFWRKSDTRIGLITTLFLVTFAVTQSTANAVMSAFPAFTIPVNLLSGLSYIFLLLFLFLFPDGRFVPGWSRLVVLVWIPLFLLSQVILHVTVGNFFPLIQIPDGWGFMVGDTFVYLFSALIPLSIGIAIIRSRLWDIDIIINRPLVYSTLTAILALVYFGLVVALNYLLVA